MAPSDDPESLPTQQWSGEGDAAEGPVPVARISDSGLEGMLGARSPQSRGRWTPPTAEELQARLPQYEIAELLGHGGMGAVYKGWQRSLDRFVAIKILPPGLDGEDSDFAARFKREAKAMARLKHPGIIPVHDAGETADGLLYFVMDYVEGTDVQKLIATEGRLPAEQALSITTHVLDALTYAHEHGIIHRDIKPANIMVDNEGRVHIADFGLARSTVGDSTMLTGSHVSMGTPDFMAPESRLGTNHVDHRADLYAVGVMLYRMLTGKLPHGRFESPSRVVPGLDKRLDKIVDRALQPERDARYSSAIELRADLDSVLVRTRSRRPSVPGQPAGGRVALYIGIAVLLLVVAGAAWLLTRPKPRVETVERPVAAIPNGAAALEPGAMKLWDTPEKVPKGKGASWEDNALRLENVGEFGAPASRDGILRASVRANPKEASVVLAIRAVKGTQAQYRLSLDRPWGEEKSRKLVLRTDDHGGPHLGFWSLPREYAADEWIRLELRAIGDEITVVVDGKVVGMVRDHSLPGPGLPVLYSGGPAFFRDIVYVPLDKPGNQPQSTSLEPGAIKLWDAPDRLPKGGGIHWENNALKLDNASPATSQSNRDAAIRASIRANADAVSPGLALRTQLLGTGRNSYSTTLDFGKKELKLYLLLGTEWTLLKVWPLPRAYGPDEWLRLELRAVGDALTVSVDGKPLGTVDDPSLSAPGVAVVHATANGFFRDIVYVPLDKAPMVDEAKPSAESVAKAAAGKSDTAWRDALAEPPLKEIVGRRDKTVRGYVLPGGNHWSFPAQRIKDTALRWRGTADGTWPTLVIEYNDRSGSQMGIDKTGKPYGVIADANSDGSRHISGERSDEIIPRGAAAEIILVRMGGQIRLLWNGREILRAADPRMDPAKLSFAIGPDGTVTTQSLDYLLLDGLSEAEVTKLLAPNTVEKAP